MWDEESLNKEFRDMIFDAIQEMDRHKDALGEKLVSGYACGMTDAYHIFQRLAGKWEILLEMRKESLKEK